MAYKQPIFDLVDSLISLLPFSLSPEWLRSKSAMITGCFLVSVVCWVGKYFPVNCKRKESSCVENFGEGNNGKSERVHVFLLWLPLLHKIIIGSRLKLFLAP